MAKRPSSNQSLNSGLLSFGFIIGLFVGAILTLLNLKGDGQSTRQWLRSQSAEIKQQIDNQDTVAESLRQGKEAARQHRAEMSKLG